MRTRWVREADVPLVMSSWLRSWKKGAHTRRMAQASYFEYARGTVEKLLARSDVRVRVAVDEHDDNAILGWLCWSMAGTLPVVHYCYTKQAHRHRGVLRGLAAEAGITAESEVLWTIKSPAAPHIAAKVAHSEYTPIERFLS